MKPVLINRLWSINEYGWAITASFQLLALLGLIASFEEIKDYSSGRGAVLFLGIFLSGIFVLNEIDLFFHFCYLIEYLYAKIKDDF